MRIIPFYLLLLPCLSAKSQDHPAKEFWAKWDAGGGLTGASINFHQNGISGFNFRGVYHFLEWGKSSFSLGLDWRIGTEDENGLFFPVEVAASIGAGLIQDDNFDASFNHQVAVYSDFPLLLHYNFNGGVRGDGAPIGSMGFYLGGGFTQTFTGYTSPATSKAAQTDFWGWVIDGGIRLRTSDNGALDISLGVTRPLRAPIGPINQPLLFQLNILSVGLRRHVPPHDR